MPGGSPFNHVCLSHPDQQIFIAYVLVQFFDNPYIRPGLFRNKNCGGRLGIWIKLQPQRHFTPVKLRQGAIIPEQSVAVCGYQNRYRADDVKLIQMYKPPSIIACAVRLLSQAAQDLILRRHKNLFHTTCPPVFFRISDETRLLFTQDFPAAISIKPQTVFRKGICSAELLCLHSDRVRCLLHRPAVICGQTACQDQLLRVRCAYHPFFICSLLYPDDTFTQNRKFQHYLFSLD